MMSEIDSLRQEAENLKNQIRVRRKNSRTLLNFFLTWKLKIAPLFFIKGDVDFIFLSRGC